MAANATQPPSAHATKLLGQGSYGQVWVYRDPNNNGRLVARKYFKDANHYDMEMKAVDKIISRSGTVGGLSPFIIDCFSMSPADLIKKSWHLSTSSWRMERSKARCAAPYLTKTEPSVE